MVTSSCPEETARLKPKPRRARSRAENTEPEWVIKAADPGSRSGSTYPMARSPRAMFTNPMHPAPHMAMPASVAIAASRSRSPVPPSASKAFPKITAERTWVRAARTS